MDIEVPEQPMQAQMTNESMDLQEPGQPESILQRVFNQYYKYLQLIKKTDNFKKDPRCYLQAKDEDFSDLTIAGWVFQVKQIKTTSGGKGVSFMSPIVTTNVPLNYSNSSTYSPPQEEVRKTDRNERKLETHKHLIHRSLSLPKNLYTRHFLKTFNLVISKSQPLFSTSYENALKNREQFKKARRLNSFFCFTHLNLKICDGRLYFVFSPKTKIIRCSLSTYERRFKPLERSLAFRYSELTLPAKQLTTFGSSSSYVGSIEALQNQALKLGKGSFTGRLLDYRYEENNFTKNKGKNETVLLANFVEETLSPQTSTIGQCLLRIKLGVRKQMKHLCRILREDHIYLVRNVVCSVNEQSVLTFSAEKWKQALVPLKSQNPNGMTEFPHRIQSSSLSSLHEAYFQRNYLKFHVDLIKCQHFFARVLCDQCFELMTNEGHCPDCGPNEGDIEIWAVLFVADYDGKGRAEISLDTEQAIEFFSFTFEQIDYLKKRVFRQAQSNKEYVRVFSDFENQKPGFKPSSVDLKLRRFCNSKFIIAAPRNNLGEMFQSLNSEEKITYQKVLMDTKEFIKKKEIFLNGFCKKLDGEQEVIGWLNVISVI